MINKKVMLVTLGILLNMTDIAAAFVLVLGGANMMNSHPTTGVIFIGSAPFLLYLSSGMWTKKNWKLISRLVLYAVVFLSVGVSAAVLTTTRGRFIDDSVVYKVIAALFVVV